MSVQRKMDMRGFFPSVRKSRHLANLRVQTFSDEEKAASELAKKILRQETVAKQNEANRMAARKRRNEAKAAEVAEDKRTEDEKIQDEIDELAEDIPDLQQVKKKLKVWLPLP